MFLICIFVLYSCEVKFSINLYTLMFNFLKKKHVSMGLQAVDLDLPSGLKWGTCNVGAQFPYESGTFFSWGDIAGKAEYNRENCQSFNRMPSDLQSDGIIDQSGNLKPEYDAAVKICGEGWHMPTLADFNELIDCCNWIWTEHNGVEGYEIRSKKSKNSIFMPAAGYCRDSKVDFAGSDGGYWSATVAQDSDRANSFDFLSGMKKIFLSNRYNGRTIRPVCR